MGLHAQCTGVEALGAGIPGPLTMWERMTLLLHIQTDFCLQLLAQGGQSECSSLLLFLVYFLMMYLLGLCHALERW